MGIAPAADQPETVGTVEAPLVRLIENHDEAYHVWRRAGASGRTLVHVDAHHDMAWLDRADLINIGNYVCQAIQDRIVSEVFWVVPDASWATHAGRSILHRHLRTLVRQYHGTGEIRSGERRLSTRLLDLPLTVCAIDSLPLIEREVLLDIDVDFFMLSAVEFFRDERPGEYPWLWPEDFLAAIQRKNVKADIVTVAYSVAGGYVPMQWKYLGDEIAMGWKRDAADATAQAGFQLLRSAAVARLRPDRVRAIADLQQAATCLPNHMAPHLNLALLHLDAGDGDQARMEFLRAVEIDASCGGPHTSRGFVYLSEGRNTEAHAEFQRLLTLDPGNRFGLLGLGRIAVLHRRWAEAEHFLKGAIEVDRRLIDAHRYLGDALVHLGRDEEAAMAYSRSLKLALEGEVSVEEAIHTADPDAGRRDGRHDRFHVALADIDARSGRVPMAIAGYQMALAARPDRYFVRMRLARLFIKQRKWTDAVTMGAQALALIPGEVNNAIRWTVRRIRRWHVRREHT